MGAIRRIDRPDLFKGGVAPICMLPHCLRRRQGLSFIRPEVNWRKSVWTKRKTLPPVINACLEVWGGENAEYDKAISSSPAKCVRFIRQKAFPHSPLRLLPLFSFRDETHVVLPMRAGISSVKAGSSKKKKSPPAVGFNRRYWRPAKSCSSSSFEFFWLIIAHADGGGETEDEMQKKMNLELLPGSCHGPRLNSKGGEQYKTWVMSYLRTVSLLKKLNKPHWSNTRIATARDDWRLLNGKFPATGVEERLPCSFAVTRRKENEGNLRLAEEREKSAAAATMFREWNCFFPRQMQSGQFPHSLLASAGTKTFLLPNFEISARPNGQQHVQREGQFLDLGHHELFLLLFPADFHLRRILARKTLFLFGW